MSDVPELLLAWPPTIPPATRSNSTSQLDNHPNDHNALSTALSAIVERLGGASSELGYAEQVAAQSAIATTTVDLTGLSITFTLTTARRVLLYANVWYQKAAPDTAGGAFASLWTGANVQVQGRGGYCGAPGQATVALARRLLLAAGTYTYKVRGSTAAGFLNTISSTAEPSYIGAIDLGPQ